jgi:tetratricopeptide (TPR) repeat protein
MERRFNLHNLGWLVLLFVLITLIGLAPRALAVVEAMSQARRAAEHDLPGEAADHLAQAAERQPWRRDLWELAGHYALMAGEPERTIEYLEKAVVNSPQELTLHALLDLGDAYYQVENSAAAHETWLRANQLYGPSHDAVERLMQIYQQSENYQAGVTVLEELIEHYPDDAELHFELALLYAALGETKAAQESLTRTAELDTDLKDTVEALGDNIALAQRQNDPAYAPLLICQGLAELQNWRLAARACESSIELYPGYAEAWAYLGLAYHQLAQGGDPQVRSDGLPELKTALELDPQSLAANSLMSFYWMSNQRYDLALEAMQKSVELAPDRADMYVDLGALLALSGDLDSAYQAYLTAVELAPFRTAFLRHLADFSLKYEYQVEEVALPAARKAIIMEPEDPANLDQMAQVMILMGDLASAERFAHRALESDPDFAPAYLRLGLIYLLNGDKDAAFQALTQVSLLAPDTPVAEQAMRLLSTYFP